MSTICSLSFTIMADFPPAKRRKTLTDTIISTAFSAALIGTAVGMTAYRMYCQFQMQYCNHVSDRVVLLFRWRDRGKPTNEDGPEPMEPPPPYEREEWMDDMVS